MHFLDSINIPVNKCTKSKSRDIVSKLVFYAQSTGMCKSSSKNNNSISQSINNPSANLCTALQKKEEDLSLKVFPFVDNMQRMKLFSGPPASFLTHFFCIFLYR